MSYILAFEPNCEDFTTQGLCGPLLATECVYSVEAGTFGELSATIMRDDDIAPGLAKWRTITPGVILSAKVPVRMCTDYFNEIVDRRFDAYTKKAIQLLMMHPDGDGSNHRRYGLHVGNEQYQWKKTKRVTVTETASYTDTDGTWISSSILKAMDYRILRPIVAAKQVTTFTTISKNANQGESSKNVKTVQEHLKKYFNSVCTAAELAELSDPSNDDYIGPILGTKEITTKVVKTYNFLPGRTAAQRYLYTADRQGKKMKAVPAQNATLTAVDVSSNSSVTRIKVKATWTYLKKKKTVSANATGWVEKANVKYIDGSDITVSTTSNSEEAIQQSYSYEDQLFRVYDATISDTNTGEIKVKARHIVYDLMGNLSTYMSTANVSGVDACLGSFWNTIETNPFTIHCNITEDRASFDARDMNLINVLLDSSSGFVSKWKGAQVCCNNYDIYVLDKAGMDRGFNIKYGKNLTGISCETDLSDVCTGIRPCGEKSNSSGLYLDGIKYEYTDPSTGEKVLNGYYYGKLGKKGGNYIYFDANGKMIPPKSAPDKYTQYYEYKLESDYKFFEDSNGTLQGTVICQVSPKKTYAFPKITSLDVSDGKVDKSVSENFARYRMVQEVISNFKDKKAGEEKVTLTVQFQMLGDTEEYSQYKNLERLFIYDPVRISHKRLGIRSTSECLKIEYDVILDRFKTAEFGAVKEATASVASWNISSVSGGSIISGTVGGSAISDEAISATHIKADSINADHIQAGAVNVANLTVDNLMVLASDGNYYRMSVDTNNSLVQTLVDDAYELIPVEPVDFSTIYSDYYKLVDGKYARLTEPEPWQENTFYYKTIDDDKVVEINDSVESIVETYSVQALANEAESQYSGASSAVSARINFYAVTTDRTTVPDPPSNTTGVIEHDDETSAEWMEDRPDTLNDGEYLWSMTRTTYVNGVVEDTDVKCIAGDTEAKINNELWRTDEALYFGDKEKFYSDDQHACAAKIESSGFVITEKTQELARFDTTGMTLNNKFKIIEVEAGLIFTNL